MVSSEEKQREVTLHRRVTKGGKVFPKTPKKKTNQQTQEAHLVTLEDTGTN